MVAEAEHGADMEHRIQSWIPTNRSCVLESEKAVQQPAAEQTCEQDGVQRRQGDWSGFQVDNSWTLPFMCEEELIFVKTCFLTRLNKMQNIIFVAKGCYYMSNTYLLKVMMITKTIFLLIQTFLTYTHIITYLGVWGFSQYLQIYIQIYIIIPSNSMWWR